MEKQRHSIIPRTSCLIFHRGKLLLIKYSEKKWEREWWYNRIWWHIEQGEWIIENAKREILEETWLVLDVKLKWVIHVSDYFWKNFMLYVTISESESEVVKSNDEWTLYRVNPDELDNYKIFKDVKIVLDEIKKLKDWVVFTAKTKFNWEWDLVNFEME